MSYQRFWSLRCRLKRMTAVSQRHRQSVQLFHEVAYLRNKVDQVNLQSFFGRHRFGVIDHILRQLGRGSPASFDQRPYGRLHDLADLCFFCGVQILAAQVHRAGNTVAASGAMATRCPAIVTRAPCAAGPGSVGSYVDYHRDGAEHGYPG